MELKWQKSRGRTEQRVPNKNIGKSTSLTNTRVCKPIFPYNLTTSGSFCCGWCLGKNNCFNQSTIDEGKIVSLQKNLTASVVFREWWVVLSENWKAHHAAFQHFHHWSGQKDKDICFGLSKMQSLAFSRRAKGQGINTGCGKEAMSGWPDPFWFWRGFSASTDSFTFSLFLKAVARVPSTPGWVAKPIWCALLWQCAICRLQSLVPEELAWRKSVPNSKE